jgi:TolB-like protein/Tfp pilus assembly protein PilF
VRAAAETGSDAVAACPGARAPAGAILPAVRATILAAGMLLLPSLLPGQCPYGTPPPCGPRAGAAPAPASVAVLYLDNLSRDTSDAYLADGLTEELIGRLGQVRRLQVKSRTAVQRFRGRREDPAAMGRVLGVAHLLSGSVQRAGGRLRVHVELTRAAAGVSVWSGVFERPAADLFAVQAEIAESVTVAVSGRLAPAERRRLEARPTADPAAYDHYLRGNFESARRTPSALLRAAREFEAALALDPVFTAAMVRAGEAYWLLSSLYASPDVGLPRDSLVARSEALLELAIRLDPASAEAWRARAATAPTRAAQRAAFERAVALAPRDAEVWHVFGVWLRDAGDGAAAVAHFRRALALEPGRTITLLNLGQVYVGQRRYAEALPWLDSAVALRPDAPFYYMELGLARLAAGDTARARTAAEWTAGHGYPHGREELLAMLEAREGDSAAARERVARVDSAMRSADCWVSHACLDLAWALAAAGMRTEALAVVERIQPRNSWLAYWAGRAEFDPVRADPRFQTVLAEARRDRR